MVIGLLTWLVTVTTEKADEEPELELS